MDGANVIADWDRCYLKQDLERIAMSLLEPTPAPDRKRRLKAFALVVLLLAVVGILWYFLRFSSEERAVAKFFDALTAGDTSRAYAIWQPEPSYQMADFLADWGPNGYYGPVKSYRIVSAEQPRHGGSGVIVTVEISPFSPMPEAGDVEKSRRTRQVRLWVETHSKSLSFPP